MLSKNQIKEIQSLQLRKFRESKKLFITEGVKSVAEVVHTAGGLIKDIYAVKDYIEQHQEIVRNQKFVVTEISESELQKISLHNTPNKVLAVCNYLPEESIRFDFNAHFSFYLDDVRDPGNFGTIVRLADWYGITDLFCSPDSCDLYNPKVIQSTMGAFLRVKIHYLHLEALLETRQTLAIYGAVLDGKNLYQQKLKNGLILIGNESNGIQEKNLALVQHLITIPSANNSKTESLNAAMATSIIGSEFFRQLNEFK